MKNVGAVLAVAVLSVVVIFNLGVMTGRRVTALMQVPAEQLTLSPVQGAEKEGEERKTTEISKSLKDMPGKSRAPTPPTEKAPGKPAARVSDLRGPGKIYIQVSSTANRKWADEYISKLKKKGITAASTTANIKGKQWYRIRIGSFPNRDSALKARDILKKEHQIDGIVLPGD